MPTIELYGHSSEGAARMVGRCRELLAGLPFCEDIVFVIQGPSRVLAWDGSERPFVRVLTRSQARADLIRERLVRESDVETVLIGFTPRVTEGGRP